MSENIEEFVIEFKPQKRPDSDLSHIIDEMKLQISQLELQVVDLTEGMKEKDATINWILTELEKLKREGITPPKQQEVTQQVDETKKLKTDILLTMLSMHQQKLKETDGVEPTITQVIDEIPETQQEAVPQEKKHKHKHRSSSETDKKEHRKHKKDEQVLEQQTTAETNASQQITVATTTSVLPQGLLRLQKADPNRIVPKRKSQFICRR